LQYGTVAEPKFRENLQHQIIRARSVLRLASHSGTQVGRRRPPRDPGAVRARRSTHSPRTEPQGAFLAPLHSLPSRAPEGGSMRSAPAPRRPGTIAPPACRTSTGGGRHAAGHGARAGAASTVCSSNWLISSGAAFHPPRLSGSGGRYRGRYVEKFALDTGAIAFARPPGAVSVALAPADHFHCLGNFTNRG
jgi:hypothetical protein